MSLVFEGKVRDVVDGKLRGQKIATVGFSGGGSLRFDAIEGVISVNAGDNIRVEVREGKPDNLEEYDFCGHGYLVDDESKVGKTILSIWGILFIFSNKLGLIPNKKYYICIRKV